MELETAMGLQECRMKRHEEILESHEGCIKSLNIDGEDRRKGTKEQAEKTLKTTGCLCKMIQGDIEQTTKNLLESFNRSSTEGHGNNTNLVEKSPRERSNSYVDAIKRGINRERNENTGKSSITLEELKRSIQK